MYDENKWDFQTLGFFLITLSYFAMFISLSADMIQRVITA